LLVDGALLDDAEALGINLSQAAEEALEQAVAAEKARRWLEENAEAIAFNNARIERVGLWSDDFRLF